MDGMTANSRMISKLFFRLLPIQILLAVVGTVGGIVSSLFASNLVGSAAMSAIGLYGPVGMFLGSVSLMLIGGAQILCGKYMGRDQREHTQQVFSLDLTVAFLFCAVSTALLLLLRIRDDCRAFDPAERSAIVDPADPARNIGIRTVYAIATKISYQNILGLNVLTITV